MFIAIFDEPKSGFGSGILFIFKPINMLVHSLQLFFDIKSNLGPTNKFIALTLNPPVSLCIT